MKMSTLKHSSLSLVVASLLVVACGSSDDPLPTPAPVPAPMPAPPPPPAVVAGTDIPLTAVASSQASTDFVKGIVTAGAQDMAEGLVVGDATLASSDSDEPDPSV